MKVTITSRYGDTVGREHAHTGVDLGFDIGTPLRNIRSGVADVVDYGDANIGKGVLIKHTDGTTDIYGHLSKVNVTDGQYVPEGAQIGLTGDTGNSTGAHLHFGIKDHGHYVDPTPYVNKVANYAGEPTLWERITDFNLGEWFYGKATEKGAEVVSGMVAHWVADIVVALPIIAVACVCVYALVSMCSKGFAKFCAGLTFIYGAWVAITL